jgi:hypothetical protein
MSSRTSVKETQGWLELVAYSDGGGNERNA